MNEQFNKNAKVEQLTNLFWIRGEEKGLIIKDPYFHFGYYSTNFGTRWSRPKCSDKPCVDVKRNVIIIIVMKRLAMNRYVKPCSGSKCSDKPCVEVKCNV